MTIANNFEVKPNLIQNLKLSLLPFLGSIFFLIIGYFMIQSGSNLIGIGTLIFAGVGLLAIIYQAFVKRKSATMILTHQGIQRLDVNYLISWSDIENIGATRVETQKLIGLRLKPYAISNLPPKIQSSANLNQNLFGYDIMFDEFELDRPISEFISLLEQYRSTFS
jgi:hypothetical protein